MRFRKILCPTDFSPASERAVGIAARLAKDADAELVLFHAWYVPAASHAGSASGPSVVDDVKGDADRALTAAARDATRAGARHVTTRLANGVPWSLIVHALEEDGFDLCVMGTVGQTSLSRVLLGSVAGKLIRHAPCSVLVVHPQSSLAPFAHVLCPTDFSASARHALERVTSLVPAGGRITLLHVIELPLATSGEVTMPDLAHVLDRESAEALEAWAALLASTTALAVTTRSRIGYPGAQTLAALETDPSIDLVVMGSHGRSGITRALMGSVAEKVARHATCPVLVARARS
ncbi:MAG: universal stress protein [Myxococcota bacterium]|nr:universal stress protein [Myxococcota bacterium]